MWPDILTSYLTASGETLRDGARNLLNKLVPIANRMASIATDQKQQASHTRGFSWCYTSLRITQARICVTTLPVNAEVAPSNISTRCNAPVNMGRNVDQNKQVVPPCDRCRPLGGERPAGHANQTVSNTKQPVAQQAA